jgi:hypothetical protein
MDINSSKETIREYIKQKPRFDEGCSKLVDQRKEANFSGCRIEVN